MKRRPSSWALVGWLLLVAVLGALGWRASNDSVDFPIYHQAGAKIVAGDYELYPSEVYEGRAVGGHGFRYAPGVAFLFVPFALLRLQIAAFIFFVLKLLAFIHLFTILGRRLGLDDRRGRLMLVVALVTGGYLLEEIRGGNLQLFIVYFCVLAFDRAARQRVFVSGISLGAAIAAKITPVAFLGYFAVQRQFRAAAAVVAILVVLALAPIGVWGIAQNNHLLEGFVRYSGTEMKSPLTARNYSVRGLLLKYQPFALSDAQVTAIWIALLVATGLACLIVFRRRSSLVFAADLHLAILLTCLPLLSPHAQRIYFVNLCVPVAVLLALIRGDWISKRLRGLAIAALILNAAASTLLPIFMGSRRLSLAYLDFSPYSFAALFLLVTLFVIAFAASGRAASGARFGRATPT